MTILVPVDQGAVRDRVLETAIELGRALDEDLYVVHLVDGQVADRTAKRIRDEIRARLDESDVPATVALEYVGRSLARTGPRVGQEVLELAADVSITHIVIGHTTKGTIEELARGSTALSVAEAADVPVTIVSDTE